MDADILAATDNLAIERIRLQEFRDDMAMRRGALAEAVAMPVEPVDTLRTRIAMRLLDKYMTPNAAATTDAGMADDALKDAKRLKAAIDAVMSVVFPGQ